MEEKDLTAIWKNNTKQQKQAIVKDNLDFVKIAKRNSKDIFNKIRANILSESLVSVIVAIGFPFLFKYPSLFFWIILVVMILTLGITIKLNINYLKKMKFLNTLTIEKSLLKKIDLLATYIKRVKFFSYVLLPVGFGLGLWFALQEQEIEMTTKKLLFITLFTSPFLFLMIWLIQKYIYYMYGKYLKRLQELHSNLIS